QANHALTFKLDRLGGADQPIVDEAIDLIKECIAQRGLENCQYAGPDTDGRITYRSQNLTEPYDRYRYIKNSSKGGISIIQDKDVTFIYFFAYDLSIFKGSSLDENGLYNGTGVKDEGYILVCELGCSCNEKFKG
ncbi:hypothetical protein, partial [Roseibium sediminis]|uniref:hypothetical protein n=1 Tax=Roseibium sediminis TaxID=1775174 RepID=UPI001375654F